jgi:hypothetical protein
MTEDVRKALEEIVSQMEQFHTVSAYMDDALEAINEWVDVLRRLSAPPPEPSAESEEVDLPTPDETDWQPLPDLLRELREPREVVGYVVGCPFPRRSRTTLTPIYDTRELAEDAACGTIDAEVFAVVPLAEKREP